MSSERPPGREEIENSGTADWVHEAMDKHQRRQDKLAQVFSGSNERLRQEKDELADAFRRAAAPDDEPADRGPDLFAGERARSEEQRRGLAGVWEQDRAARAAEEEQLRGLFGPPKSSGKKPPRR